MDRNSTIGLVLIGLIITVFSVMNQPSEAEIKAAQKKEAAAAAQKAEKKQNKAAKVATSSTATSASNASQVVKKGELTTIENNELRIELNSKGGMLPNLYLSNVIDRFCFARSIFSLSKFTNSKYVV